MKIDKIMKNNIKYETEDFKLGFSIALAEVDKLVNERVILNQRHWDRFKQDLQKLKEKKARKKMIDLNIYEIARRNMIVFCNFYIINDNMTKDDFFRLQKEVLEKIKSEGEK